MENELLKQRQIDLAWRRHRGQRREPRIRFSPAIRIRLCGEQNWKCCYCGGRMMGTGIDDDAPSFEHVIPRWDGGPDTIDNIVIACRKCNTDRGCLITEEHVAAIAAWEGWD